MQKSARVLGHPLGLSSQDFNWLLADQGFIEGKPNAWGPTAKGLEFIVEKHEHRGTGGYAHYNRDWTETTWPEEILDVLDLSKEKLEAAKEATRNHRAAVREARLLASEPWPTDAPEVDTDAIKGGPKISGKTLLIAGTIVIVVAGTAYVVVRYVPPVRRRWDAKVAPRLSRLAQRWTGRPVDDPESDEA